MTTVPAAKRRRAKHARATLTLLLFTAATFVVALTLFDVLGVPLWP
jgi:hypothetical protein